MRLRPIVASGLLVATLSGLGWIAPAASSVLQQASGPVVLVGIAGLQWSDLSAESTPTLWRLAGQGDTASMTVRTVRSFTCPVDGWLTVSAGRRAAVPGPEDEACPSIPVPQPAGSGAQLPGWDEIVAENAGGIYDAQPGRLGDELAAAGVCVSAVGPGAATAAADSSGRVSSYVEDLDDADLAACPLTVIDLGAANNLARVDAQLAAVVAASPDDATLLLAGISDRINPGPGVPQPHLRLALTSKEDGGADDAAPRWLTSQSTRRQALVQLTDIAPTLYDRVGVAKPASAVGQPWRPGELRPSDTAAAIDEMINTDTAAQVVRNLVPPFFTLLVVAQLVLYAGAAVALIRRWGQRRRRRVLAATRRAALVFAAVPVSTFLANLVPWWRTSHPLPMLVLAVAVAVAVVTLIAQLGPWRGRLLGPFGAVGAITALVLAVDVVTGSALQQSSLMGYSPLVAGRFYGFGNVAFAIFASGALLGATGFADPLLRRGRTAAAVTLVVVTGMAAVVVDATPGWGSDFGGVLALVPGFAVLAMLVAGIRISPLRFVAALAAGVVAVGIVAILDWRRPTRTHLGDFVQQVLDGTALDTIARKAEANWSILTSSWLNTLLVPAAIVFLVLVLARPLAWRAAALQLAYEQAPVLRHGLLATAVTLGVGFAVNDSGIAIPATALTVVIPLTLAASVAALEHADAAEEERGGGTWPSASRPWAPSSST
jgi:hypothetical protein